MLLDQQTRMIIRFRRAPRPGVKRRSSLQAVWSISVLAALSIILFIGGLSPIYGAQRVLPKRDLDKESPVSSSKSSNSQTVASPSPRTQAYGQGDSYTSSYKSLEKRKPTVYADEVETTRNAQCVQKTFHAPTDKNAALIGAFLLQLLPDKLRSETSWRYNEKENTLTVYGPEKAIEYSEQLLRDFSEPLYEEFLKSEEYVGVAGVAPSSPLKLDEAEAAAALAERQNSGEEYYDPTQNDVVKVAYNAEGAIVPNRQEYAVTFGGGDKSSYEQPAPRQVATAAQVWGQPASAQAAANNDDAILDVVSYRCLPSACEQIGLLVKRQFASNPSIAFSVDRNLGTIVVHTNRKLQREVGEFLASIKVYPDQESANAPDLRLATGALTEVDGLDTRETTSERAIRQAFTGGQTSMVAEQISDEPSKGEIDDFYTPQNRKASELRDALLQLFGDRLQRKEVDPNSSFTDRQIATYRFVKRQRPNDETYQACYIAVDVLHNRVEIQGNGVLCAQMLTLLRAMDQRPLQNGNVRRFIPIKNGDSYKIRQILEYDSQKSVNTARTMRSRYALDLILDRFNTRSTLERRYESALPLTERYGRFFTETSSATDRSVIAKVSNKAPQSVLKGLQAAYRATESLAQAGSSLSPNATVRQVAYQEGVAAPTGTESSSSDYAPNPGYEPNGYDPDFEDRGRQGVGIVQDFAPTVLQDLDVVIVDNATEAEFERIKQMIEQIEELAKIADIQTEIYNLEHVNCLMLHGVLTTLYTEMFTTKQGRVVFYALQNPNAILVAGWGQAFKDMKDLIELFDQPIEDGSGTLRVVHLKYASVDEIASLLTETFVTPQTTGTGGLAPRIRAFADVRTNSLVVQAAPNDWNEIQKLLLELDVNKATTKLSTRIFPLKNSLAEDIRTTILNAILPAKQGTLDTSAAKFPILELLSVDESGRKLVESGIMMDVDVIADVYHNQLIVNAPDDCMEFMERLIELLDIAPKKAQIRFFQVRHGDASQIIETLQSLLATSDNNLSAPTIPQAEGEETFVPVRFALDTRTNVIIAAAAPKELAIVDALIVALDVKDLSEREEVVVQLRNIQALVVAQAIDDYLSQKQTLETASEVLSNYQLYESQIIVIPESISNSIIVSASPDQMDGILEMIRTFDKDPAQVVIQVLIAEVTLSNQEEFGIEAGLQDSVSFERSLITTDSTGSVGKPGYDIIGSSSPGQNVAVGNTKDIAGQVLNNFAMGASSSSLGYGGFVLSASSRSIDLTLRALREKNRLQVLSRPQVTAMDNQQAFILVGQRVPRINGTTTTNYGVQMNTTDTPVGLILLVTPRVTQDGKVVMEIGAEKSSLGNDSDATPIYSQDGEVIKSKSIDTIQAMTAISARDGETVMLGGLLTSSKEKISRGVPYLSDVPVLGWLFRYDQEVESRKELLIVMTPRIMRSSADYGEALRTEMNKTHVSLDEAMSINGNMGLYDPRTNQGARDKKTKRLLNQVIHPDKMDDLESTLDYSPDRDYAPRPAGGLNEPDPYSRPNRSKSTSKTVAPTSKADQVQQTRKQYSWDQDDLNVQQTQTATPSMNEDFKLDDDIYIPVDDNFTSNDRREPTTRVAMRERESGRSQQARRSSEASSSLNERGTKSSKSARRNTESSEIKARSSKSDKTARESDDNVSYNRAVPLDTAERFDFVNNGTIRGQDLIKGTKRTPLSRMKEDRGFKLFFWKTVETK